MTNPDDLSATYVWAKLAGVVFVDWDVVEDRVRWRGDLRAHGGSDSDVLECTRAGFLERVHPEDRERVRDAVEATLDSDGDGWTLEYRILRSDDQERSVVRDRAKIVRDDTGRAVRVLSVLRRPDPAEDREDGLRETTAALRERVKELRTLYRVSSMLIDADRTLDETCRRLVSLLPPGWQHPEIAEARIVVDGRTFSTDGFRETPWTQVVEIPGDGGPVGRIEVAYTEEREPASHDDGPFLREEADLLEEIARRVGAVVRRTRADEERERSEAHFRMLAEHATDVITVLAPDATIRYESPSVKRMLGYEPEELVGRSALELIHPDDRSAVEAAFYSDSDADVQFAQYRCRHKDGSWRHLESTGQGRSARSDLDGVLIHSRDVTERAELEARLREARKLEAVGRMASGIAHDFNNLLMVIRGNADLLAATLGEAASAGDEVDEIRTAAGRAAARAAALTRDLLAFGRQENLRLREIDLGEALDTMRADLEASLPDGVRLDYRLAPGANRVRVDPALAEQVFEDLVNNALEAMPDGGRLRVEVREEAVLPGSPAARDGVGRGRWIVFSVGDTGVGMSPDERERAIEPFFSTKEGQSGLGLSSAFGLVKQTGGEMRIESTPGKGTTVEVYLPSVEGRSPRNTAAAES